MSVVVMCRSRAVGASLSPRLLRRTVDSAPRAQLALYARVERTVASDRYGRCQRIMTRMV